jgi:Asp-tRNA(Asn)/Glu-tRNA(Gln) amidotransferase A subunit family amidase
MPIPAAYADSRDDGAPNPANFSELDALHLAIQPDQEPVLLDPPCGFADGLPIGLQVNGPLFGDLDVLQACRAYEAAAGVSWSSSELTSGLDAIAFSPDAAVASKRWPKRP